MVPSWFRSPLAIFAVGVLVVALSVLVLMSADSGPEEKRLASEAPALATDPTKADPTLGGTRAAIAGRGVSVVAVAGRRERSVIDQIVVVTAPVAGQHTIFWLEEDGVRNQMLSSPSGTPRRTLQSSNSVVTHALQRWTPEGHRELGLVYDATALGSGSPTGRFALLRLEEGEWQVVWDSGEDEEWRGSHGYIEFPNGDLSELIVRSDSWIDGQDELSDVVHESNPGPHRYFVDTWIRDGDEYVRNSAETVPAPYATFVEFLHALSIGDEFTARDRVTDASLLSVGRDLGLGESPTTNWLTTCESGLECGKEEPIRFDPRSEHGEPSVAVYFEERDGQWLISDIQPDNDS